jgi:hypothetical protein
MSKLVPVPRDLNGKPCVVHEFVVCALCTEGLLEHFSIVASVSASMEKDRV